MTVDNGFADVNLSVGDLCFAAIDLQLQPYKTFTHGEGDPRARPRRPHYATEWGLRDRKRAEDWWSKRSHLSLRELQIEVLEWIDTEESRSLTQFEPKERDWIKVELSSLRSARLPLDRGVP